eukprot:gene10897-22808_t
MLALVLNAAIARWQFGEELPPRAWAATAGVSRV